MRVLLNGKSKKNCMKRKRSRTNLEHLSVRKLNPAKAGEIIDESNLNERAASKVDEYKSSKWKTLNRKSIYEFVIKNIQ